MRTIQVHGTITEDQAKLLIAALSGERGDHPVISAMIGSVNNGAEVTVDWVKFSLAEKDNYRVG